MDYLPADAAVFLSESGRVDERVKNAALQLKQDTEALLTAGVLAGDHARLALTAGGAVRGAGGLPRHHG